MSRITWRVSVQKSKGRLKVGLVLLGLSFAYMVYQQWRMRRLMTFRDLAESRTMELNEELKYLSIEDSVDSWKTPSIQGSRIFSAYLETRPEVVLEENPNLVYEDSSWAFVRIIAIIPVELNDPVTCHFKFKDERQLATPSIRTQLVAFEENFGMKYSAAYILCPLPYPEHSASIKLPVAVTASTHDATSPNDNGFVRIRYPKHGWSDSAAESKSFSVCIQPLHHEFDKSVDLIAFIEFYRMMGVGHFTFYKDSVTPAVDSVLNYYRAAGNIVTVLEWKLPNFYAFEETLRVDGIFAALNDCLYRSTSHLGFRYVAGVDVDEYIVPRMHENFSEMMEYLDPARTWDGAWIFRNVFFYLMYEDDASTLPPGVPKLKLHAKTRRTERANGAHDRSKFIVRGEDVIELGNHRVWRMKRMWSIFGRRYKEVTVDPAVGTSNHYRNCETFDECWRRKMTIDRTGHRFTWKLSQRVAEVKNQIFGN